MRFGVLLACVSAGMGWVPSGGSAAVVEVRVSGEVRAFNGVTEIPAALFGVHATRLTPERQKEWGVESVRVIVHGPTTRPIVPGGNPAVPEGISTVVECFYDRYQPALLLSDPRNWQAKLEDLARGYGLNARQTGLTHHIEFWNEPFLNWATRPGVNYDAEFYEQAGREEGRPMTIRGGQQPLPHLVWSRQLRLVDPANGKVHYLANGDPPVQRAGLSSLPTILRASEPSLERSAHWPIPAPRLSRTSWGGTSGASGIARRRRHPSRLGCFTVEVAYPAMVAVRMVR